MIHAVISVGLDINEAAFQYNVKRIKEKGGYYGRVNIVTGEKDEFTLNLISFKDGFLEKYFNLAEAILQLTEKDTQNPEKMPSHTATVTYHAVKGHYGLQRTFVPWEPVSIDDVKGVIVKPEHCWMYFFNPTIVEALKLELNHKSKI